MGGRRHPASGGVDGLCNKNTWSELRKRGLAEGGNSKEKTAFIPPHDSTRQPWTWRLFNANWDLSPPRHWEHRQKYHVMRGFHLFIYFFEQTEGDNCTVSQPSGLEWKSAIFCLPRPGVEPLENKPTVLLMCFSRRPRPRTITWMQGILLIE